MAYQLSIHKKNWGLTPEGLKVPRYADFLTMIRETYEAEIGEKVDWERDTFLGTITATAARQYDEQAQQLIDIYNSKDPDLAQGIHLDIICGITGIRRQQAKAAEV